MDQSEAAITARQPALPNIEAPHFTKYRQYRSQCAAQLIQADSYELWVKQFSPMVVTVFRHAVTGKFGWSIGPKGCAARYGSEAIFQTETEAQKAGNLKLAKINQK